MTGRSETHRKLDAFSQHLLDACRFVLVSPSLSANIGSAVRALTTMGIPDLMVAAPRDAAFREDAGALALAAGAEARLAQVGSRPSLDAALADCQLAVAVSAEGREFGPPPAFPGPLCAEVLGMLSAGQVQRVAFVFGTERTGLGTTEMARCQRWLTIPADADYSSLNLAQAVQIVAFSLRQAVLEREAGQARASGDVTPTGAHSGEPPRTLAGQLTDVRGRGDEASLGTGVRHDGNRGVRPSERLADLGAVEGLYRHAESSLAALGTLDPARPRRLMARLRHLFGRTSLTAAEVDLLRGICRDIDRRTKCAQSAVTGSAMPSAKDMT
ncbi:RNA methyltransferase [Lautropia mirabilis]|uniref:RNA methyltransferase n=1 Tax=Lautropia mirabilis TaxID=47671 RepID=UPI0028ED147C|nr:TrmH family RNA methyltransferase [Lautropia mirabilis]